MSGALKVFLDEISQLLESYRGRDKILKTLCYSARLIGGLHGNEAVAEKLLTFSRQMSATRTTLRLLDDLPMLKHTLEYGFGAEEPDFFMSSLGVTCNIIDQISYPVEKISWLAEHKLIAGVDQDFWGNASSVIWVASTYLTLLRNLKCLTVLYEKRCEKEQDSESKTNLLKKRKFEMLTSIRLTLDLIHAVNTLPRGFLWSAKLNTWQVGLVATTSSLLGIYQIFMKRSLK